MRLGNFWSSMRTVMDSSKYILDRCGLKRMRYTLALRNGLAIRLRPCRRGVVSDIDIVEEVLLEDVYQVNRNVALDSAVVDIGAHIGAFTMLAALRAKAGRIFAYEPTPENFELLSENVTLNRLRNVLIFPLAVGARKGKLKLTLAPNNTGGHTAFPKEGSPGRYICADGTTLEDIFERHGLRRINLLKIDCEGGEYPIVLGTRPRYLRRIDCLLIEQHLTPPISELYSENSIRKRLRECGFSVHLQREVFYPDEGRFWLIRAVRKSDS